MATTSTVSNRIVLTGVSLSTLLIAVHATNDAFSSMLAALLPTFQLRFGLSEGVLALLVATLSFSSSVLQPFFGSLADRFGQRLVGAFGIITSSSLLSLMGVVPDAALLFVLLFVGGLGSAAFHPSGTSMARAAGGANKALTVSLFSAGGTLGLALGPSIILLVARTVGLQFSPLLMIPGVLLGVAMYFLIPVQPKTDRVANRRLFDWELFRGPVGVLCVSGILRSVSYVTFTNAVPLYLVSQGASRDSSLISMDAARLFARGRHRRHFSWFARATRQLTNPDYRHDDFGTPAVLRHLLGSGRLTALFCLCRARGRARQRRLAAHGRRGARPRAARGRNCLGDDDGFYLGVRRGALYRYRLGAAAFGPDCGDAAELFEFVAGGGVGVLGVEKKSALGSTLKLLH